MIVPKAQHHVYTFPIRPLSNLTNGNKINKFYRLQCVQQLVDGFLSPIQEKEKRDERMTDSEYEERKALNTKGLRSVHVLQRTALCMPPKKTLWHQTIPTTSPFYP